MIWPGAQGLVGGAFNGVPDHARFLVLDRVEKTPAAVQIAGDGRQRLVQFMRQGRRHFPHGAEARNMDEGGLQIVQPLLGLLPFGEVAHETGEEVALAGARLADRQLHRESRTVAAQADDDPAAPDDAPLAGHCIALQIGVMLLVIGRGHQNADILADDLVGAIAEQTLGGDAEGPDDPSGVDDDHRIGHRIENGAQMRFALHQRLLRPLRGGDVAGHLRSADQASGAVPHGRNRQRHVDDLAILAPLARLEMLDPLAAFDALQQLEGALPNVAGREAGDRRSDHLLRRVAEHRFRAPVPIRDDALERHAGDGVVRRGYDRGEAAHRRCIGLSMRQADQNPDRLD